MITTPSPNLTLVFIYTQFVLFVIVFAGVIFLRVGENILSSMPNKPAVATTYFPAYILGFGIITLACIGLSQDFLMYSRPVFGDLKFPTLDQSDAFLFVFTLNIVGAGILVNLTGGTKDSPFSAVLFSLPALTIFVREPPGRILTYTALVIVIFLAFQNPRRRGAAVDQNPRLRAAFYLVTLSVLSLSSLVGYVTRPL